MRSPLFLRCYAKQTEGQWVAVCVDLSLAAQADTYAEARAKLEAQVNDYVHEAVTVHAAYARDLLDRPAPLEQRAEYHWIRLKNRVAHALHSRRAQRPREEAFEQLAVHA